MLLSSTYRVLPGPGDLLCIQLLWAFKLLWCQYYVDPTANLFCFSWDNCFLLRHVNRLLEYTLHSKWNKWEHFSFISSGFIQKFRTKWEMWTHDGPFSSLQTDHHEGWDSTYHQHLQIWWRQVHMCGQKPFWNIQQYGDADGERYFFLLNRFSVLNLFLFKGKTY